MPKFIDITGHRYGELTVIGRAGENAKGRPLWRCLCDCGREKISIAYPLRVGDLTCCGAHRTKAFLEKHRRPQPDKRKYPEGTDSKSRLWTVYRAMHLRCHSTSHSAYSRYGGRGIHVCAEWRGNFGAFREWALANGYADDLSIDRIDNAKGYSPDNCRFATRQEQALNRRNTTLAEAFGETKTLREWVSDPRCKVGYGVLFKRIAAGHAPEFAMTATQHEVRSLASIAREAALKVKDQKERRLCGLNRKRSGP